MLAVIAAILLGLALVLELIGSHLGGHLTNHVLEVAGVFFLACHFASSYGWRGRGWRR